jgi:hypothetical protein
MRPSELEDWRGPHEGIEFILLKNSDRKPAALIDQSQWDSRWAQLLSDKNLVAASIRLGPFPHAVIVTRAGDTERQRRLIEEFGRSYRDHFRLGLLLGYCLEHVVKFCNLQGRFSSSRKTTRLP